MTIRDDMSVREYFDTATEHFEKTFLIPFEWTGFWLEQAALCHDDDVSPQEFALRVGRDMGLKEAGGKS